jgi:hypothetical protein
MIIPAELAMSRIKRYIGQNPMIVLAINLVFPDVTLSLRTNSATLGA